MMAAPCYPGLMLFISYPGAVISSWVSKLRMWNGGGGGGSYMKHGNVFDHRNLFKHIKMKNMVKNTVECNLAQIKGIYILS